MNNSDKIKDIIKHYQNRKFDKAEKLALLMTVEFPENPIPWKVLGAIFSQTGRKSEAINVNQKAIELTPDDPQLHNNLGITFQEQGRFDEAEASFRQSILIKNDFFEAHNNLGITFQKQGRFNEAEASYRKSIFLKPEFFDAHNNLGISLQEQGRFDEAEASFRQSIFLKSDNARAYNNLGNLLKKNSKLDEAEASFKQSIRLNRNNTATHNNLGNLLKDKGDLSEAINCFKAALKIKSNSAETWNNIFFPLQAIKSQGSSIKNYILTENEQTPNSFEKIFNSILNYRLNVGSLFVDNYFDKTLNLMNSHDHMLIKNPKISSGELIANLNIPKKITALVHFGRSGTGLLHSLVDGHPEVSTLPSIYFSEFFDHFTWKKITINGWEEMANNFTKIYATLFDSSSSVKIASKGMKFNYNVGLKEGMTNLGIKKNEIIFVNKETFIKELNYLINCHDSIDPIIFFKLVHLAYEKSINNHNKKNLIFYHIHNPDVYAQLNFLRLAPNANWLVMVREPIQSCESWIKRDFYNNNYKIVVGKIFDMLFEIDHVIYRRKNSLGVKLEDLKLYPKKTIQALCKWLSIDENECLYHMTAQGKQWWGDPTSPDYSKDGMAPFGKASINRKLGSVFSDNDLFIMQTLFYPFSIRFGYAEKNLEQFKKDLLTIRPMINKMFDFEKKIAQRINMSTEKFMKSGSYLYLRSGIIERWNVLYELNTYPHMLNRLIIN
jgi:Flp pilus assembly protein TadD